LSINQCTVLVNFSNFIEILYIVDISELREKYGNIRLPKNFNAPAPAGPSVDEEEREEEEADGSAAGTILYFI